MEAFSAEAFTATMALVGVVIVIAALFSGVIERSNIPQVAVFLAFGAVLGPAGLGLLHVGLESPALRVVATLSLTLVLFTDALTLDLGEVRRHARLAGFVLWPGTLLSAILVAVAGWGLLGLEPAQAAILGAALSSTDPVLLRGLLRRRELSSAARQALRLESGLNDVVLLPIVLVAMELLRAGTGAHDGPDFVRLALNLFLLGPSAGVAIGLLAVATLDLIRRRVGIRRDYESLYSLGVAFAAFAAAESVHGSGFLAAFAAGLTILILDVELCDCFLEYGETTSEMALLFTFVLFGSSLIWTGFDVLSGATLLFAVLVLLIRPVAFQVALAPVRLERRARLLISWFGPRGLSTLLLVLLPVFEGLPGTVRLFSVCCLVVLMSVTVHGGALIWLSRSLERQAFLAPAPADAEARPAPLDGRTAAPGLPEVTPVADLPIRGEAGGSAAPEATPPAAPAAAPAAIPLVPAQTARQQRAAAPPAEALPADSIRISLEEVQRLQDAGAPVIVLDARSERTYEASAETAMGTIRLDPDQAAFEARRLSLPPTAWLVAFCA